MTAFLVVDLESSALDPATLTMLEFAWTVIDPDGAQRLPIRSRYTALTYNGVLVTPHAQADGQWLWHNEQFGAPMALRMAQNSGLFTDWAACRAEHLITSTGALERLLLDDLAAVCSPQEEVHFHGAGVAQFDQPALRLLCPTLGLGATHYRPADTSVAQTTQLGATRDQALITWGCQQYGHDTIGSISFADTPLCGYCPPDKGWLLGNKVHRASADVARAIAIQRTLWRYAEPLRAALDAA